MENNEKKALLEFQLGLTSLLLGIALISMGALMALTCPIGPMVMAMLILGPIFTGWGAYMLIESVKKDNLRKQQIETEHLAEVAKLKTDEETCRLKLIADNKAEVEKIVSHEEMERNNLQAAHTAELEKINAQKELDRFPIIDSRVEKKRTYVIGVLADFPNNIGLLHTNVPAKIMGKDLDFHSLIEGNPDPALNTSGFPMNPGGAAGKTTGVSIRTGVMISGQAHCPNSFPFNGKDLNVLVVMIYNAEFKGTSGHAMEMTGDTSSFTLTPLDRDLLRCTFLPLDEAKEKANNSLLRQIIAELPEWLEKNKP